MKTAIFHALVRDSMYPADVRIVAVTTAKQARFWGRVVDTEMPTNFAGRDLLAQFTGPDGEARARMLMEPVKRLLNEQRAVGNAAYRTYERARAAAQKAFDDALKIELERVRTAPLSEPLKG